MKRSLFLFMVLVLAAGLFAGTKYSVEESEDIQKTLKFQNPSGEKTLMVDNIFGFIHVEGTSSDDVRLSIKKTIKAKNSDRLAAAKEEVSLDISEEGNTIDLFVDGPFRDKENRNRWNNRYDPRYEVHYQFTISVPKRTTLCLKTVTEGDISVHNVEGDFDIRNVNGKIELYGMNGSGIAHTVNGRVEASFVENPKSTCSFKTINGDVRLHFQPNLSADFRIKSFTGDAFSDFPVTYLPSQPGKASREKGKYVYKSDFLTGVRVGQGGPEIKMDTMTGDILIEKFK